MTQNELLSLLFVTAALYCTGFQQVAQGRVALGAFMFAIPMCGWLSIWLGR